jgi:outer membrane lipoprotein carrier protein
MSYIVRSSEFGVRSKGDTVRSSELLVRSKEFKRYSNFSNHHCIGILRVFIIFLSIISCGFISAVDCSADAPLRTPNPLPTEARFAQAGDLRTSLSSPSPFDEIKKTYAEIKTLEAQFSQKIFISSLKKERDSKGEFFFKRQKGFLWRYKAPKAQYFLYDGKFIWQGEDDKPFVTKDKIDKEKTGGTFFDLVEDIAKIDELFTIKEQKVVDDFEVFELLPKKEGTVNSAKVWIDKQKRIKKLEIYEFTGNINTIEFSGIKVNQPLDDGKFVFKRDGSKEIVERDNAAPQR